MNASVYASLVAALLSALCVAGCHPARKEEVEEPAGLIPVRCVAARTGAISNRITVRGVVRPPPEREVVVSALVAGRLLELRVREGDRVTKGQVLALVDQPQLASAATEAGAGFRSAQATRDNAVAALQRAQRLFDQGIAAKREVDDARTALSGAEAALEAAHSRQDLAITQRSRAAVTSPIAGVIMRVYRAPGDVVDGTSQTPLVEVADPSALELRADAPAAAIVQIPESAPAEIHLDALPDSALHGHAVLVAPSVDPATGLGMVRIAIDKSEVKLKIGLAGRADLEAGPQAKATLVKGSALRRSIDGTDEVVVCAAGQAGASVADVRAVQIGARDGEDVQIRKGLAVGERVVVDHPLGLQSGAGLSVQPTLSPQGHAP